MKNKKEKEKEENLHYLADSQPVWVGDEVHLIAKYHHCVGPWHRIGDDLPLRREVLCTIYVGVSIWIDDVHVQIVSWVLGPVVEPPQLEDHSSRTLRNVNGVLFPLAILDGA